MKLLTFQSDKGAQVGATVPEGIVDLTAALRATHPQINSAHSLLAIIESGIDIDTIAGESLASLRSSNSLARYLVARPQWLPPIPRPPKILALALNYREHINENAADPQGAVIKLDFHEEPIIFAKYSCNLLPARGRDRAAALPADGRRGARACPGGRTQLPSYPALGSKGLYFRLHDLQRRIGARPPDRAFENGTALRVREEFHDLLSDGTMDRHTPGDRGRDEPEYARPCERRRAAQRKYLGYDLQSLRSPCLLL